MKLNVDLKADNVTVSTGIFHLVMYDGVYDFYRAQQEVLQFVVDSTEYLDNFKTDSTQAVEDFKEDASDAISMFNVTATSTINAFEKKGTKAISDFNAKGDKVIEELISRNPEMQNLKVETLTKVEYEALSDQQKYDPTKLYAITDISEEDDL